MIHRLPVLLLILLCLPLTAETLILRGTAESESVTDSLLYRLDPEALLRPAQIASANARLHPLPRQSLQIPRNGKLWLELTVENRSGTESWVLENRFNVERMEVFLEQDGVWIHHQATGNAVPYNRREFRTRTPAFELLLTRNTTTRILLTVEDLQSSNVQLYLKSADRFRADYLNRTILLGLVFGFFAALIIYNLLVFMISRERIYLIYALYMIVFSLNQAAQERLITQYLEPDRPYGFFWFILFGGATIAAGVEFFRAFVDTPRLMPRLDRWMHGHFIGGSLISLTAFVYAAPVTADILNILGLSSMALIVYILAVQIRRGNRQALICLAGSIIYIAGTAAEILTTLIPVPVGTFAVSAQLYGALAQVLFLGFALGSRNRRLQLEYEGMQRNFRHRLEDTVRMRTAELEEANRKLQEHAVTDSLTGLYNRGALDRRIDELDRGFARGPAGTPQLLSAAYLDLDSFKYFNDSYGHKVGDRILTEAAEILKSTLRGDDLLFRMGGDEFLILMPGTDMIQAEGAVQRLIAAFSRIDARLGELPGLPNWISPSVSIGLTSRDEGGAGSVEELIHQADEALLNAKVEGKNRYSVA